MVDVYVKRTCGRKDFDEQGKRYYGQWTEHIGVIKANVFLKTEGGMFLTITNQEFGRELKELMKKYNLNGEEE